MNIDFVLNKFNLSNDDIMGIFRTGGSLLLDNCKDEDYIIIYNKTNTFRQDYFNIKDREQNIDYFGYSMELFNELSTFSLELYTPSINRFRQMFLISMFISENIKNEGLTFDLIGQSEKFKQAAKDACDLSFINPNVTWEGHEDYCQKHLWYVILGLMFIENNSYEMTPEMKEIVQKCHDGCLPKSWEDWVKERIYTDNK